MDVIVCNGFGAYLGMKTCEYLGNKVSSLLNTLISVTERSCAAPISKVVSHISDRCSYYIR